MAVDETKDAGRTEPEMAESPTESEAVERSEEREGQTAPSPDPAGEDQTEVSPAADETPADEADAHAPSSPPKERTKAPKAGTTAKAARSRKRKAQGPLQGTVVDAEGHSVETVHLSAERFGVKADVHTLHLVVRGEQAARRRGTASTKTRAEVAGQISLRLPAVLGARSHHNFPSTFAEKLAAGQPVTVFNPDGLYNTCVHGSDIAVFVSHLIETLPTGINKGVIAAREPIPMIEAVGAIADAMGVTPQLEIKPANQAATTVRPESMQALGYAPATVADTLARFGRDRRP